MSVGRIEQANHLHPIVQNIPIAHIRMQPRNNPINGVKEKYEALFGNNGIYKTAEAMLFKQLKIVMDKEYTIDTLPKIYEDSRKINGVAIDAKCREGYVAYRFYIKTIVDKLQIIDTYIKKGQSALSELKADAGLTEDELLTRCRAQIITLEICDKFVDEILQDFQKYSLFNNDTKQWEVTYPDLITKYKRINSKFISDINGNYINVYGNYIDINQKQDDIVHFIGEKKEKDGGETKTYTVFEYDINLKPDLLKYGALNATQIYIYENYYRLKKTVESLRTTSISYKDASQDILFSADKLNVFNSLNLLDRLKFIRTYYKLVIEAEATDWAIFPNNTDIGFPCMPNIPSTDKTKDTQNLGAMELFYVGYLIDRDGPINAVSSFFEVKVQALRENLSLSSKKISALNTYLQFVNRGMNILNGSQSNASNDNKKRIPEGAGIALLCLCGSNMYNLFESDNKKYLVFNDINDNMKYFLVTADENGMNFLVGSDGNANNQIGNANCFLKLDTSKPSRYCIQTWENASTRNDLVTYTLDELTANKKAYTSTKIMDEKYYNNAISSFTNIFKLPTQLDCAKVIPNSVKEYLDYRTPGKITTNVVSSWTTAFSDKTKYIDTAINTINTDIQVDRTKIDSFDSICSVFRSRAHDAYANITANIRS